MQYSPNMLKTFEECQKKYFFKYVKNISVPQKISVFEKGKTIHALANYWLRGQEISKFETILSDEEKILWSKLKNNEYLKKEYINSEYTLNRKIGEYFVTGRIDALVKSGNDYFILDYKTGSVPKNPEYDFQTMIYLLMVKEYFPDINSVAFVYIDLKNNLNKEIVLTDELEKEYKELIIQVCTKIEQANHSKNYPQNYDKCKYCEYRKICL